MDCISQLAQSPLASSTTLSKGCGGSSPQAVGRLLCFSENDEKCEGEDLEGGDTASERQQEEPRGWEPVQLERGEDSCEDVEMAVLLLTISQDAVSPKKKKEEEKDEEDEDQSSSSSSSSSSSASSSSSSDFDRVQERRKRKRAKDQELRDTEGYTRDERWAMRMEELREFKARFGHVNVPQHYEVRRLVHWVRNVKNKQWKNLSREKKQQCIEMGLVPVSLRHKTGRLHSRAQEEENEEEENEVEDQEEDEVEEVDEDDEDEEDEEWQRRLRPRERKKEQKNDANRNRPTPNNNNNDGDDGMMAVCHQSPNEPHHHHHHHRQLLQPVMAPGANSPDRHRRQQQSGVQGYDQACWDQRFRQLRRFFGEHGHFDVPWGNPLYEWVRYNRRRREHGRLLPEREAKLNSIGFTWEHRSKGASANNNNNKSVSPAGEKNEGAPDKARRISNNKTAKKQKRIKVSESEEEEQEEVEMYDDDDDVGEEEEVKKKNKKKKESSSMIDGAVTTSTTATATTWDASSGHPSALKSKPLHSRRRRSSHSSSQEESAQDDDEQEDDDDEVARKLVVGHEFVAVKTQSAGDGLAGGGSSRPFSLCQLMQIPDGHLDGRHNDDDNDPLVVEEMEERPESRGMWVTTGHRRLMRRSEVLCKVKLIGHPFDSLQDQRQRRQIGRQSGGAAGGDRQWLGYFLSKDQKALVWNALAEKEPMMTMMMAMKEK